MVFAIFAPIRSSASPVATSNSPDSVSIIFVEETGRTAGLDLALGDLPDGAEAGRIVILLEHLDELGDAALLLPLLACGGGGHQHAADEDDRYRSHASPPTPISRMGAPIIPSPGTRTRAWSDRVERRDENSTRILGMSRFAALIVVATLLATGVGDVGAGEEAGAQGREPEAKAAQLARVRHLGFGLDVAPFGACPQELPRQLARIATAVESVAQEDGARAARRDTYALLNDRGGENEDRQAVLEVQKRLCRAMGGGRSMSLTYPRDPAVFRPTGEEPLPVLLVPPTSALDAVVGRPAGAGDQRSRAGTIWFEPLPWDRYALGKATAPRSSLGLRLPLPDQRFSHHASPALQGKVVAEGALLDWARAELLRRNREAILGEVHATEIAAALYELRYRIGKKPELATWGVPVADANGGARWTRTNGEEITAHGILNEHITAPGMWRLWAFDTEGRSRYENVYGGHLWSTVGRHSLLVVAKPVRAGSGARWLRERSTGEVREQQAAWEGLTREERDATQAQERLVVTRELLRQHPVLILRKAGTWLPFMEDADFDSRLAFHGSAANTARVVVVSADVSDSDLMRVVRSYYGLACEAASE